MIAGAAIAAFYLLFRKTAPTAQEVFRRQQERPNSNVGGVGQKKYENAMPPAAMIPPNASIPYSGSQRGDSPEGRSPSSTGTSAPNPFKKDPNQDGLPPGFSGSFDDDPDAVDLDGVGEDGDSPEAEES